MTTPAGEPLVVALLGEIALRKDGALAALPGARSRLLLAALALRPGRSRSAQALIDDVWGEQPPRAPMNALHTQVSRLRTALPDGALEIGPAGYRLTLAADQVDLTYAGGLVRAAQRHRDAGDLPGCLAAVAAARALWRGEPAADLPAGEVADELRTAAAARLTELDAIELAARESSGDIDGALRLARLRAAREPLDEPAQLALMRLLATAGRPNEALESFATFRARLADQLGADPGPALVELNTAILRGEPVDALAPREGANRRATGSVGNGNGAARPDDGQTPGGRTDFALPMVIGLRAAPNALLGREADLAAIDALLSTSRVTTVLGPGGAGKTRIANEVGARAAGTGPVVLVELASVRGAGEQARTEIEDAIGAAIGLSDMTLDLGPRRGMRILDARQRLRDALSIRPMLLILDNCEHLIDAVAVMVADLIGAADRLRVLTTSRAPLMITAETVYPLPPLTIDAAGSPATELFAARARAVRPGVRLDPDIVAQLCHTLDGLPLAIELAAARVRVLSVEEINTRLADRFALLRHGDRSSPERHRTLHAVIDWSWQLLDTPQQVALRRLCRFPAGFTLAAAEVVAGGPEVADVAGAVDGLVNQSLLTVLDDEHLGTRYRMLETVREYGEEQLARHADESELVTDRMMAWARDFADDAAVRYADGDQVLLALSVAAELDNLLAVLRYAVERRDAYTSYTVFPVISMLWVIRGSHQEVVNWATRVFELVPADSGPEMPRADLVLTSYEMLFLHLAYTKGDPRELARIRWRVRTVLRNRTDLTPNYRFIAQVMTSRADGSRLGRLIVDGLRSGDRDTKATALLLRANVRENDGDVRGSARDAMRALEIFGDGNVWSMSMVCRHLGQVCGQTGRYAESIAYYRRALDVLLRLGAYEDTMETRAMLVASLIGTGELAQARHELDLAMRTTDFGTAGGGMQNRLLATITQSAAELELAQGNIEAGLGGYRHTLELFGWPDNGVGPGPGALMIAAAAVDAHVLYGALEPAARLVDELIDAAVPMLGQYPDRPQLGAAACGIGSYLIASGRAPDTGLELLVLAPNLVARQDFPVMLWERHADMARAALGAERVATARKQVAHLRRIVAFERILGVLGRLQSQR
ncbi:AfsR/SARP family transcriptional regulator [Nocardia sp. NPDC052566]|uniref:AfsR/SARP family transcriptional regulator n=1 Tax=Nocardia sp. NPDC052566 TaxID=3364330 RepID=UPI0037CA9BDD